MAALPAVHTRTLLDGRQANLYLDDSNSVASAIGRIKGDDSSGVVVWPSTHFLMKYIQQNRIQFEGRRVLELGSGVGLVGIFAAPYCQQVVITDGNQSTLDLAAKNLRLNSVEAKVSGLLLSWGQDIPVATRATFDFVIGAEIMYKHQLFDSLFYTARSALREAASSRVVMAFVEENQVPLMEAAASKSGFVCASTEAFDVDPAVMLENQVLDFGERILIKTFKIDGL